MTTMHKWLTLTVPALALLVAGCSETTFQDTLGMGKSAPDETRVRTVQPLSVPPDLELRPPAPGTRPATAETAPASTGAALSAPPDAAAPVAGTRTASATPATAATAANTSAPGKPGSSTESSFYDIYKKYGISLYKPDGTRKKISELNRELAEKIKEEKRRQNPRYGSIFNIDSLWKD